MPARAGGRSYHVLVHTRAQQESGDAQEDGHGETGQHVIFFQQDFVPKQNMPKIVLFMPFTLVGDTVVTVPKTIFLHICSVMMPTWPAQ